MEDDPVSGRESKNDLLLRAPGGTYGERFAGRGNVFRTAAGLLKYRRWSYGHVMTDEKIAAQGSMLERIMPNTNAVQ